ncbi:hypothetical protein L917_06365 [Phytophthora nicotianae]|uniref:Uncharacterized protein n=3 Tax=Phytophthora nicotianae TaxID=4792 RepID=V9DU35_PHYNI|nr:hypothetical protein F443_22509 [Phytophthora nicotianae P1569]ETL95942.1 hypothetical protein L917_06365 [Phytophthora nicotianae]ETM35602.1 hypothetical protein L914_17520 [Phytophthora nicotianae]ETO59201.1 hypothetical protein F444_22427 [Phytophthora nicotianae P1976]
METVKLMQRLENESVSNGDHTNDDSELEDGVPPTQTTEPVQNGEEKPRTQLKQSKLSRGADRLAVHKYPSHLTVSLKELLTWAKTAPNLKDVLEKYHVQLEDPYFEIGR